MNDRLVADDDGDAMVRYSLAATTTVAAINISIIGNELIKFYITVTSRDIGIFTRPGTIYHHHCCSSDETNTAVEGGNLQELCGPLAALISAISCPA